MEPTTDEELIRQSREGVADAFATLVHRYESRVAGVVYGMLGRGAEADDVGQEVFIRFYESMHRFRGESSLSTYLIRIAMNLSLNELKRRKRRNSVQTGIEEASRVGTAPASEWDEVVQLELRKLEPEFRSVVTLRLLEGYSTEETSKMLDIPLGTVLSRLSRAQMKLKKELVKYQQV